ncbi:MAG: glycosyltransferase [Candidatus Taylorbacteria bacterium]|nr:glycosyltransferase [Candidatus Taylorbacteria bacterium]
MKLLFITQKLDKDDDVLGFVHRWVDEFSKSVEKMSVLCLEQGSFSLSSNTKVFSLGKEVKRSKLKYLFNFYKTIWRERNDYDAVFVHMNQMYVILGFPVWKMLGKKVTLWYAHGHVPFSLRIALRMVSIIFTSTSSGCRLKSSKIQIVGQGIDTDYFVTLQKNSSSRNKLVMVGRLSPIKDHPTLFKAISEIVSKIPLSLSVIGTAGTESQRTYEKNLIDLIRTLRVEDYVKMLGSVNYNKILPYLQDSDMFINPSLTGSLDKAGLEAMAVGLPILTCNEAYKDTLGEWRDTLMFNKGDVTDLSSKITGLVNLSEIQWQKLKKDMREIVVVHHGLPSFAKRIIEILA